LEKLVIDNTICGMAYRLVEGVRVDNETLAIDLLRRVGPGGTFLAEKHTMEWFRKEQFMPSELIDRQEQKAWKKAGSQDIAQRAREMVKKTLREHETEPLPPDVEKDLDAVMSGIMKQHEISTLPLNPTA
jgi:trimethylamine--corrinoid protein Co-methyltransferase